MPVPVEQITAAVEELLDANRVSRAALEVTDGVLARGLEILRSGGDLVTTLQGLPVADYRQVTQDNADRLNAARHRLRVLVIAACVDAGQTPGEIAERWGLSRQRIDQFLQEYRRSPHD